MHSCLRLICFANWISDVMIVNNYEIRRIRTRRRRKKLRRLVFSSEKYSRDEEKIRNMKEKRALWRERERKREREWISCLQGICYFSSVQCFQAKIEQNDKWDNISKFKFHGFCILQNKMNNAKRIVVKQYQNVKLTIWMRVLHWCQM